MKKNLLIALLVLVLGGVAILGLASTASAQDNVPPVTPNPQQGGRWGRMGGGMAGTGQGVLHADMQPALAEKLGLTVAELEELHTNGQTFWQIAEEKGYTLEEARQMMLDARSAALDKAAVAGTITQEQADWMKQRGGGMMGAGGCTGAGTQMRGGMRGRWNSASN